MPASLLAAYGGLLLVALLCLPAGLCALRGLEALLGRRFPLTPIERTVLGLYATGALLFLLASIPAPIYGVLLVAALLSIGFVAYGVLVALRRTSPLRQLLSVVRQPSVGFVIVGFLGLLLFEVAPLWNHPFSNAWDGSVTALWTNLILRQGSIPTTLQPFASAPVIYPMASSVWMTVPVLVLGWSTAQTPVLLPALFLSLSIPAAYSWGSRWALPVPSARATVGLTFAAFFGLVASVPRLYTGGWYDFALALPLLMIAIGFLPQWADAPRPDGKRVVAWGLLVGTITSLSLAAGEAAVVLALAFVLARHRRSVKELAVRVAQVAALVLFELAFTARSVIVWVGSQGSAYVPKGYYGTLDPRLILGELDPFVPWKAKLSPFPWVALELQILLAAGLAASAVVFLRPSRGMGESVGRVLAAPLLTGTLAAFLMTGFLLLTALSGSPWESLGGVTDLGQSSVVLFLFLDGLALLPLAMAATELLGDLPRTNPFGRSLTARSGDGPRRPHRSRRRAAGGRPLRVAVMALVIVLPLTVGTVATVVDGPSYLQGNVGKTSNVTSGDVAALQWAGAHLPACSVVLVAPGSAAQFLPEYAVVRVAFPMNPVPTNASYGVAVANLTLGVYGPETRTALAALGVTEVFVTGQTSVSYPPFLLPPMESSPDFAMLESSGDAAILAFLPVLQTTDCPA